jgi:hypothetical protein
MTTWHPTEDHLILQFYGELRPALAREVAAHLDACELCRAASADLAETLALADAAAVPEPPSSFESVMWARVSQALPASGGRWQRLVPVAALSGVLVAAALAGQVWPPDAGDTGVTAPADARVRAEQRILMAALDGHFEQTELLLVELMNATAAGEAELLFERETAGDLVASGRLYRATARATGEDQFAQMLEDLETVLVDVAHGPAPMAPMDVDRLRGLIETQDLLFKVRAAASEVRVRQQSLTLSEGPL